MKKHFIINTEIFSTNDTIRLRNNLTMQSNCENIDTNNNNNHRHKNNLERSRSGRKDLTQKSTPASLVPSTTENNKINIFSTIYDRK